MTRYHLPLYGVPMQLFECSSIERGTLASRALQYESVLNKKYLQFPSAALMNEFFSLDQLHIILTSVRV